MKKLFLLIVLSLSLILTACDEEAVPSATIDPPYEIYVCEDGIVRLGNGIMYKTDGQTYNIIDYKTMQEFPVCTDVNCSHDVNKNNDCAGYYPSLLFAYKNKIFYIESDFNSNSDNMLNDFFLCSSELDGTSRKRHLMLGTFSSIDSLYLYNDMLYFCPAEGYYREGDILTVSPDFMKSYVVEVDMNTLSIKYTTNIIFDGIGSLNICGRNRNNFYLWELSYNSDNNDEAGIGNYLTYNIETKEIKEYPELNQFDLLYSGGNYSVYKDKSTVMYISCSGEEYALPQSVTGVKYCNESSIYIYSESNPEILYRYDIDTKTLYQSKELTDYDFCYKNSVIDEWNGNLIIQNNDISADNYKHSFSKLSLTEFEFSKFI